MSSKVAVAVLAAAMALGSAAPAVLAADSHAAAPQTAQGMGVIVAVDAKAGVVTIKHDPIAALKWPAMTMKFKVESAAVLDGVVAGKKVHFVLKNDNGKPVVTAIHML